MPSFTLKKGGRYRATLALGLLERFVNNETVAEELRTAGFADVTVEGSGATRTAEVSWPGEDRTDTIPSQVKEIEILTPEE